MVLKIILVLLILVVVAIVWRLEKNARFIVDRFRVGNVIVFGQKGKGKDLIFQKVIAKRKERYFSNMDYGYNYNYLSLIDLALGRNTYENFIEGVVEVIEKNEHLEGADIYISDAGIYLPAQYHYLLDKKYKSLPIFYALSRHLYNNNVHVNVQALNRVWDKLREQADSYFKALKTVKICGLLFTKVRYYETYQTAFENRAPMRKRMLNKFNKGLYDEYEAYNGLVFDMWIVQRASRVYYDTRYFHSVVFGSEADEL
ncbi:MAG: hypothetical protein QXF82_07385 [Nitrososphaeria archaeon]